MNTPSSNPFADEPLPSAGPRLTSVENPLNPYAAPAAVGQANTVPPPGVGLWRDGAYLVIHQGALFPERCLITGEETSHRHRQQVRWYYPIDFATRTLRVEYSLTPPVVQGIWRQRMIAWLLAPLAVLGVATLCMVGDLPGPAVSNNMVWSAIIAFGICLYVTINAGRILKFERVNNAYLWLRGARRPFLDTLPQWPGFGGLP